MALNKFALAILCPLIAACSSQQNRFTPAGVAPENRATVYIYRPASFSNIVISPDVLLNGETLFTLPASRYGYTRLAAGTHEFKLELGKRYTGKKHMRINIESGQDYYLKVNTTLQFEKNAPYTRRFDLLLIEADKALNEIKLTQLVKSGHQPAQTTNDEVESNPPHQTPQFDLSKSRNPFAK